MIHALASTYGLEELLVAITKRFGTPYLVGGTVRDYLLGTQPKDIDIEVFDIDAATLVEVASQYGDVKLVGESFGVYKVTLPWGQQLDLSLPRRERKTGDGHRGFEVEVAPFIDEKEAQSRRDYTINSMLMSPFTGEITDPFGGWHDLNARVLRATSPAFKEDPLRVLRGVQFAARFNLHMDKATARMCQELLWEYPSLAKERIWTEWEKFLSKGRHFEAGFDVLRETGWITLYPELEALIGCPQEERWHPEGDVYRHTALVMEQMARIAGRDGLVGDEWTIAQAAALVHDLGKPATTVFERSAFRSPGHDKAGEAPARSLFARIGAPSWVVDPAVALTKEHMAHSGAEVSKRNARRLANRLHPFSSIVEWERLVEADASGRAPAPAGRPGLEWLEMAVEADCLTDQPKPIVTGHTLIARGLKPGVAFKGILGTAYDLQLEGVLDKGNAASWLDDFLADD